MEKLTININLSDIKNTAIKGVRRTAVFLGLGINASNDNRLVNYELADISPIHLIPSGLPEDTIDHFKSEFGKWIVCCGMRELIEWFALFLDQLHHACLLMKLHANEVSQDDVSTWHRAYHYKGIEDKIKVLNTRLGFDVSEIIDVSTIQVLRNCLAHRAGTVSRQDLNDENKMTLKWLGFSVYVKEPDGNSIDLLLPIIDAVELKKGGDVLMGIVEKEKSFDLGEVIHLDPKELLELCNYILICTEKVAKKAIEFARSKGVPETSSTEA